MLTFSIGRNDKVSENLTKNAKFQKFEAEFVSSVRTKVLQYPVIRKRSVGVAF